MELLDLLLGQQKIGTPGINPNAPDPRPNKPMSQLDAFLQQPGGSMLMNLLAQSGRSLTPGPSPLGAIGRAALTTQAQQRQAGMDDLQKQLIQSRIGLNRATAERGGNPSGGNVQSQFITEDGKLGFLRRNGEVVITEQDVKDSFAIQQLPDGSQLAVNRSNPSETMPVVTAAEANAATVRAAQTQAQAEATTELPQASSKANNALNVLDQIENHEGLPGAVGFKGPAQAFGLKSEPVAGTPEADFVALVNQASGAVFLEAFQELKGGGHITEIEGQKAEQAVARIGNRDQSESGYKKALDELKQIIKKGLERKRRAAQGNFSEQPISTDRPISEMTDAELEAIVNGANP